MSSLFPFLYQCYSNPSHLFFNDSSLLSAGVQQGDPLGPLCFSLTIHGMISKLSSELNVWYLEDGTLAGKPEDVCTDFEAILAAQDLLGLKVNMNKCEFSILGAQSDSRDSLLASFRDRYPDAKFVAPEDLCLLGTPLPHKALDPELKSLSQCFLVYLLPLRDPRSP